MTKTELLEELKKCQDDDDTESAHIEADDAILKFIEDDEIQEAYDKVGKWYS